MCVYCMMADHAFRFDPPWDEWNPLVPRPFIPTNPIRPWPIDRLREYEEILKRIKTLEDQLGCPCEPAKADYLDLFRKRIEELEKKTDAK